MATNFVRVRPGNVITSDAWNEVLTRLEEIEQRVASLEKQGPAPGQVVIASFDPPNQVEVGQVLTINGLNFAFPPANNIVKVDNIQVIEFRPDSTPTSLKFILPSVSAPPGGRNVVVSIQNNKGSVERSYRVLPSVPVSGDPPVVTNALREDGSSNLRIGQVVIISGDNFSATASENRVHFVLNLPTGTKTYPDTVAGLPVTFASVTELRVIVPNITEVPAIGSLPVTLRVGVGAHVPAVRVVSVIR